MTRWAWLGLLIGCGGGPSAPAEPEVPEQCKNIHLDRLAIDWLALKGSAADPKTRLRVLPDGEGYRGHYVGGFFTRVAMEGRKRERDVMFTEVPTGEREKAYNRGKGTIQRLYVEPSLKTCSLKVRAGTVDKAGKEQFPPQPFEMVPFPVKDGVVFAYDPPSKPLFLGPAASDRKVADKQVAEMGGPAPDAEMGAVPVGLFTPVAEDGDEACTYDFDAYFDDQRVAEAVATAAPVDGFRHWTHTFDAPFSGNHHFNLFRYRTCADGKRALIDVAAIEAILQ